MLGQATLGQTTLSQTTLSQTNVRRNRLRSHGRFRSCFGQTCGMTCTFEDDESGAHVLVHRFADDFVLPLQVVHAVLVKYQNNYFNLEMKRFSLLIQT